MFNAPHILETALLLLAAFLIGCVGGYLLRRLAAGRARPVAVQAAVPAAEVPPSQLVVAPRIAPLPVTASTAAGAGSAAATTPKALKESIRPAHVAGEITSTADAAQPVEPPAEPERRPEPVAAPATKAAEPIEISWSELSGRPAPPAPELDEEDTEDAAMRAIEGGWTPRPAPPHVSAPVELPEPVEAIEDETPAATIGGASPAEVAGAISSVRSAVAAAGAAAEAALLEHTAPGAAADEGPPAAAPTTSAVHTPFGKPAGLSAPRDGARDDLHSIKGLSPQTEAMLNDLGIFHFDQIAAWDRKAIVWIENHFALKGRIGRDRWIEQARELAKGKGVRSARR